MATKPHDVAKHRAGWRNVYSDELITALSGNTLLYARSCYRRRDLTFVSSGCNGRQSPSSSTHLHQNQSSCISFRPCVPVTCETLTRQHYDKRPIHFSVGSRGLKYPESFEHATLRQVGSLRREADTSIFLPAFIGKIQRLGMVLRRHLVGFWYSRQP
jgi:hypothetical protein